MFTRLMVYVLRGESLINQETTKRFEDTVIKVIIFSVTKFTDTGGPGPYSVREFLGIKIKRTIHSIHNSRTKPPETLGVRRTLKIIPRLNNRRLLLDFTSFIELYHPETLSLTDRLPSEVQSNKETLNKNSCKIVRKSDFIHLK